MARRTFLTALVLAASALASPARADDSIRCDGGLVSKGDTRVDLLAKCGRPSFEDGRTERAGRLAVVRDGPAGAGVEVEHRIDAWTYDFGPQRFVQTVILRNGRVESVERGTWGRSGDAREPAPPRVSRCEPRFREGDRKADLVARCGEPAARDRWEERRGGIAAAAGGEVVVAESITVERELWTYNLGRSRFLVLVHLENGVVTRVETGGHGYGAP